MNTKQDSAQLSSELWDQSFAGDGMVEDHMANGLFLRVEFCSIILQTSKQISVVGYMVKD